VLHNWDSLPIHQIWHHGISSIPYNSEQRKDQKKKKDCDNLLNIEHNAIKQMLDILNILSVTVLHWMEEMVDQVRKYSKAWLWKNIYVHYLMFHRSSLNSIQPCVIQYFLLYTCSIEFLHDNILKISIPFSTTLIFAKKIYNKPNNRILDIDFCEWVNHLTMVNSTLLVLIT
jgi:hypothetical protein